MYAPMKTRLLQELDQIEAKGLSKDERVLTSPQSAHVEVTDGREVINMCANNYLGLSSHPEVVAAAREALDIWGYGLSSVRFICGTQQVHKKLESVVSTFLQTEDTILYTSCFDANTGLFETLLGPEDTIISDELNHASIIDGIRLCKARRLRYKNSDMRDLEAKLQQAHDCAVKMIATDGVFSMDGTIADLEGICDLAEQYEALVMVDDSHAVGFMGRNGRGTPEHCGVMDRVDVLTGTFGKALGGASGGYTSGRKAIVDFLRQRSRPYLFSNTLAPMIAEASCKAIELVNRSSDLRDRLEANTRYFRQGMSDLGFDIRKGTHPIVPIMLGDAVLAQRMAAGLLEKGVYVIGFSYPVVPLNQARIRVQISAVHTRDDLDFAMEQFKQVHEALQGG